MWFKTKKRLLKNFLREKVKKDAYDNMRYQKEFLDRDLFTEFWDSHYKCKLCSEPVAPKPMSKDFDILVDRHIRNCSVITTRVKALNKEYVPSYTEQEFEQWKIVKGYSKEPPPPPYNPKSLCTA